MGAPADDSDDRTWWRTLLGDDPALDVPPELWDGAVAAAFDADPTRHGDLIPDDEYSTWSDDDTDEPAVLDEIDHEWDGDLASHPGTDHHEWNVPGHVPEFGGDFIMHFPTDDTVADEYIDSTEDFDQFGDAGA